VFGLLSAAACSVPSQPAVSTPRRIISLAPNVTEVLFALGLGDRVVGVTRFCDYPPEVAAIPKVGGYMDPSYESIVALRPDLTILLTSHRDVRRELEKLHIRTMTTPHETIADIRVSIQLIGGVCGVPDRAAAMIGELDRRMSAVRAAVAGRPRPRVLICLERDVTTGQLSGLYMAGRHTFYDEILEAAGGTNASTNEVVTYPEMSAEGVVNVDPEIIVDLTSRKVSGGQPQVAITRQWDRLATVTAVRTRRVYAIVGDYALRPGPRYAQFIEELARLLHPEAFDGSAPRG
jgi:iron complex transport system substrate-binding protein